jgi:hypothetical protein
MPSGGKKMTVTFWSGPQALQRSEYLKVDLFCPLTVLNVANAGILITFFYLVVFITIFVNALIVLVAI